jgi:sporulation-control protein spo0M
MLLADYDIIKLEPNNENAEKIYLINTLFTQKFLDKNEIPCLEIYYEEMLLDTKNTINKIKKFVRTDCDIDKAVNNVDKREVACQQQQ